MIQVEGLRKVYADGKVGLEGMDLELDEGMFGLLGPNGAGKTTFLSMLVLSLAPTSGRCMYDGMDGSRSRDQAGIRAMIGYLPQEFTTIRHLTGYEYLVHCARLRRVPMSRRRLHLRVMGLLEDVSLAQDAHRPSGEYSGGMRRRLGFCQALVHNPKVVVVDEPTAGLDPEERINFRNLITEISEEKVVLLSTHIVEDIEATCPRIGIIAGGRLLYDGPPGRLLRSAEGKLWLKPEGVVSAGGPAVPLVVGRRVSTDGGSMAVVYSEQAVPGASPHEATLEEAYSAYLALRGHSARGEGEGE